MPSGLSQRGNGTSTCRQFQRETMVWDQLKAIVRSGEIQSISSICGSGLLVRDCALGTQGGNQVPIYMP